MRRTIKLADYLTPGSTIENEREKPAMRSPIESEEAKSANWPLDKEHSNNNNLQNKLRPAESEDDMHPEKNPGVGQEGYANQDQFQTGN